MNGNSVFCVMFINTSDLYYYGLTDGGGGGGGHAAEQEHLEVQGRSGVLCAGAQSSSHI